MEEILTPVSTMNWDVFLDKLINLSTTLGSKLLAAIIIFLIGRWIVKD